MTIGNGITKENIAQKVDIFKILLDSGTLLYPDNWNIILVMNFGNVLIQCYETSDENLAAFRRVFDKIYLRGTSASCNYDLYVSMRILNSISEYFMSNEVTPSTEIPTYRMQSLVDLSSQLHTDAIEIVRYNNAITDERINETRMESMLTDMKITE